MDIQKQNDDSVSPEFYPGEKEFFQWYGEQNSEACKTIFHLHSIINKYGDKNKFFFHNFLYCEKFREFFCKKGIELYLFMSCREFFDTIYSSLTPKEIIVFENFSNFWSF